MPQPSVLNGPGRACGIEWFDSLSSTQLRLDAGMLATTELVPVRLYSIAGNSQQFT